MKGTVRGLSTAAMLAAAGLLLGGFVFVILAAIAFCLTVGLLMTRGIGAEQPQAMPMAAACVLSVFVYVGPRHRMLIGAASLIIAAGNVLVTGLMGWEMDAVAGSLVGAILAHSSCLTAYFSFRGAERLVTHAEEAEPHTHCRQCGYDLRGLRDHRCPECGTDFKAECRNR